MKDSGSLKRIRIVMLDINVIWLVFYVILVNYTCRKIVSSQGAKSFIESLSFIPGQPWKTGIYTFTLVLLLGTMMIYGRKILQGRTAFILYTLLEILLGLMLFRVTNSIFSNILLIAATDILVFACDDIYKLLAFLLILAIYVAADTGIHPFAGEQIELKVYLDYYSDPVRSMIMTFGNFVKSGTVLLFMYYMVMFMRITAAENERIRQLNEKLDKANEELKSYAKTVEKMSETRERNRLAREIHDTLGHTLTGIISSLDGCITLIDISTDATKKLLKKTRDVARQGMVDVRRSVNALRPDALEKRSLKEALEGIINDAETTAGVNIEAGLEIDDIKFAEDEEDAIYRTVQESITNAIRHGESGNIKIELLHKDGKVIIDVQDDGKGCENIELGFGLRHMQERVKLLNGSLIYESNNGFHVHAEVPIRWGQE